MELWFLLFFVLLVVVKAILTGEDFTDALGGTSYGWLFPIEFEVFCAFLCILIIAGIVWFFIETMKPDPSEMPSIRTAPAAHYRSKAAAQHPSKAISQHHSPTTAKHHNKTVSQHHSPVAAQHHSKAVSQHHSTTAAPRHSPAQTPRTD